MKIVAFFCLFLSASAEAQFGFIGDLLGLGAQDVREVNSLEDSDCSYSCEDNGGCVVNYVGRPRAGNTAGSCFPNSFGGGCSGTPAECSRCNRVLTCEEPGRKPEVSGRPSVETDGDVCDYSCHPNGSCKVQYVGPPRSGNTAGSCFPDSYGGKCSGTPAECQDCNRVLTCQEPGPSGHGASGHGSSGHGASGHGASGHGASGHGASGHGARGSCEYDCSGWPFSQCEMKLSDRYGQARATCIPPYFREGSTAKVSNYPECASVPRGCERCDDYCARQEGRTDRFDY